MDHTKGQFKYTCIVFAIIVIGTGLGGMTQTALNTVATIVLQDLNTDIGWGQWLTTLYIFAMGAAVPLASFVQRRFSVKQLMLLSFGFYLLGSLCDFCALDFSMLLIGRILEALASGVLMPLLQTFAMTRFPESRHGTAMGVAGIALGFAPNIGPVAGGAICSVLGWRAMFLILVVVSAALILLTLIYVKERDVKDAHARLDWISLTLSTLGFGGVLLGFTAAANMPFTDPLVWLSVLIGVVLVVLFVKRQRAISTPLINLRIFRFYPYRRAMLIQCGLYGCFVGMTLIIPLTVIEGGGHSVLEAGAVLFPGALAALIFEPGAGAASDKFGVRRVAIFGGVFLMVGALSIAFVPLSAPLWLFALCQMLRCVGLTSLIPSTTAWGLSPLGEDGLTPDGSAALIMMRQIFASLATAVMVCIVTASSYMGFTDMGYHLSLGFSGLLGALTLILILLFVKKPNEENR